MSENNNRPPILSDVALERVMRDVLGLWEHPAVAGVGEESTTIGSDQEITHDEPDECP
ncbi:MAG: hypothetical protein KZQ75_12855 [Candidatus Thiodiazotropha sp. (ex Myrtea spinifera)]|nr:hypothetical protein [Candidatus Thiodiazotropha sp. (ex Myrtea spinifera)]MCU7827591.1 hypothetical protein [Candidatus Thiodiazotropha sp. (ex Myrtea sp. 'scaly one' KF741663)]